MGRPLSKSPFPGLKRNPVGGKVYWTHRATGKRLLFDPWTPEGALEVHRLNRIAEQAAPRGASLTDLIGAFQASPDWSDLAANTRRMYQVDFDWLGDQSETIADAVTEGEARQSVATCRDARGVRAAQLFRSHMARLYAWGRERGHVSGNPWAAVAPPRRPKGQAKGNRRLSLDELRAIIDDAADAPGYRALIGLCLFGGLRIGDAAALERSAYDGRVIRLRAQKNRQPIRITVRGILRAWIAEAIAAAPAAATIATSERGEPWTKSGYDGAWARRRARLEAAGALEPGATWHGLRHSLASILREMGEADSAVAAAIGDSSAAMASTYARGADAESMGDALRQRAGEAIESAIFGADLSRSLSKTPALRIAETPKPKRRKA